MAFRMVEIGQYYVFEECIKNNRKDKFEQHLQDKLAAQLLQECFRYLKLWHQLPSRS